MSPKINEMLPPQLATTGAVSTEPAVSIRFHPVCPINTWRSQCKAGLGHSLVTTFSPPTVDTLMKHTKTYIHTKTPKNRTK